MASEISWYIDKRVIKLRVFGISEQHEFEDNNNQIYDYIQQGVDPVYLIVDVREVTQIPLNFNNMLNGLADDRWKNRIAFTFLLSDNRLINFLGVMASKVTSLPVSIFKTMDEANAQLSHLAPDLASFLDERSAS